MKLSEQALVSLALTLQKGLMEQTDITDILRGFVLEEHNGELFVLNPPKELRLHWADDNNEEEGEE